MPSAEQRHAGLDRDDRGAKWASIPAPGSSRDQRRGRTAQSEWVIGRGSPESGRPEGERHVVEVREQRRMTARHGWVGAA